MPQMPPQSASIRFFLFTENASNLLLDDISSSDAFNISCGDIFVKRGRRLYEKETDQDLQAMGKSYIINARGAALCGFLS